MENECNVNNNGILHGFTCFALLNTDICVIFAKLDTRGTQLSVKLNKNRTIIQWFFIYLLIQNGYTKIMKIIS